MQKWIEHEEEKVRKMHLNSLDTQTNRKKERYAKKTIRNVSVKMK